jgi:SAM-dependent methyltransferase
MRALPSHSDAELLGLAQSIYEIPSLAAWRAAELKALRQCSFPPPILEIGCGNGHFASLLLPRVACGIDLNPRQIARCVRRKGLYGRLSPMDARALKFPDGAFATVFANCVMEHIPDLARVLTECRRVLRPGGALIATVPLVEMNRHLLLSSAWYARVRAEQLQHLNLLSKEDWLSALYQAGFATIRTTPYLSARMCELWDRVDGPLCMGAGPLTLGQAYRLGLQLLPATWRSKLNRQWQHYFIKALHENPPPTPCAMLIEAAVPGPPSASTPQPAT